jgi:gas vesicle protein
MMDDRDYTGMSAFLAGAFIGAGIALLLAPQSGTELRGLLRRYAYDAKDEIFDRSRQAWDSAVERGKEYLETGRETLKEAGKTAQSYAKDYMESGRENVEKAAKEMSRGRG